MDYENDFIPFDLETYSKKIGEEITAYGCAWKH